MLITIALTWETDLNKVAASASRVFAWLHMLQCLVALFVAWWSKWIFRRRLRLTFYGVLAAARLLVLALGLTSEQGSAFNFPPARSPSVGRDTPCGRDRGVDRELIYTDRQGLLQSH